MSDASPSRSFAGYSVRTWLTRNKGSIKLLVAAGFGYLAAVSSSIADPALNALVGTGVGIASKMALDAVDYWLSEVEPS